MNRAQLPPELVRVWLENHGDLVFTMSGHSMRPALFDRDRVRLQRAWAGELKAGDVAALARNDGVIVIHRIVRSCRRGGRLMSWGDALPYADLAWDEQQVLAKAVAVVREGGEKPVPSRWLLVRWRRLRLVGNTVRRCLARVADALGFDSDARKAVKQWLRGGR